MPSPCKSSWDTPPWKWQSDIALSLMRILPMALTTFLPWNSSAPITQGSQCQRNVSNRGSPYLDHTDQRCLSCLWSYFLPIFRDTPLCWPLERQIAFAINHKNVYSLFPKLNLYIQDHWSFRSGGLFSYRPYQPICHRKEYQSWSVTTWAIKASAPTVSASSTPQRFTRTATITLPWSSSFYSIPPPPWHKDISASSQRKLSKPLRGIWCWRCEEN